MPPRKATEAEIEEIKRSYITPEHFQRVEDYSRRTHLAVSFREAGEHTIARISENQAKKPHTILEKSIKESSTRALYPDMKPDKAMAEFSKKYGKDTFEKLKGFIGEWEYDAAGNPTALKGIYVTDAGAEILKSAKDVTVAASEKSPKHKVLRLSFPVDARITSLKSDDGKGVFYTGDYDLHEMVHFSGVRTATKAHHILADSPEEKAHLRLLNSVIQTGKLPTDPPERKQKYDTHSLIQHGPQEAFIAHMKREEHGKPIVESVARMTPGVAMCDRGTWYLFRTNGELREWYESVGLPIKSSWKTDDASFPRERVPIDTLVEEQRRLERAGRTTEHQLQKIEENRICTRYKTAEALEKPAPREVVTPVGKKK